MRKNHILIFCLTVYLLCSGFGFNPFGGGKDLTQEEAQEKAVEEQEQKIASYMSSTTADAKTLVTGDITAKEDEEITALAVTYATTADIQQKIVTMAIITSPDVLVTMITENVTENVTENIEVVKVAIPPELFIVISPEEVAAMEEKKAAEERARWEARMAAAATPSITENEVIAPTLVITENISTTNNIQMAKEEEDPDITKEEGIWTFKDLTKALTMAPDGMKIVLMPGTYTTSIVWPTANNLTLKGERAGVVFTGNTTNITVDNYVKLTISGITFQDIGRSQNVYAININNGANLRLTHCNFFNNHGALRVNVGESNISYCKFRDNFHNEGAAIYGGINTITASTFYNNKALMGNGGAITKGYNKISRCSFIKNKAPSGKGGAISGSQNKIYLSKFTGNEAMEGRDIALSDNTISKTSFDAKDTIVLGITYYEKNNIYPASEMDYK